MNKAVFAPLPDEFPEAHAGRVALFHCGPTKPHRRTSFIQRFSEAVVEGAGALPLVGQLAALSGMSRIDYALQHSFLPAFRVADYESHPTPHGARNSELTIPRFGAKLQVERVHLCRDCVKEDIASRSYSWYRRIHNLPGVEVCRFHARALERVSAQDPWRLLPHQWMARGETVLGEIDLSAKGELEFQCRLHSSYEFLLALKAPFNWHELSWVLLRRSRELMHDQSFVPSLSDIAARYIPGNWFERNCIDRWRWKLFLDRVREFLISPAHGFLLATALATLFDDPEEILRYFHPSCRSMAPIHV